MSNTVGLRELRQDASEIVRRVESGEEITITISGRPSVRMVPIRPDRTWRRWEDIAGLFAIKGADYRDDVRDAFDDSLRDPWAER